MARESVTLEGSKLKITTPLPLLLLETVVAVGVTTKVFVKSSP